MDEPLPEAEGRGQQFIGSSTAPRGDSYDCHTGRFEIVVLLPNSNLIPYTYYIMTRLVVTLNVKSENKVETCSYPGFVVQLMFACLILICLFVYLPEGLALKLIYLFAYFTVFVFILFILFVSLVHFLFV